MGVLIRKQKGVSGLTGMAKLSVVVFLASLSASLVDTIWAIYLDSFFHSEVIVGFISAGLTLVSFISYFVLIPYIEKNNKSKIYAVSLFMFGITYLLFALNKDLYFTVALAFIVTILYTLRITSFGIIIKQKSGKKLSRNEGLMYTFMNVAWVVGPLIAGHIAERYSLSVVFVLSSIFIFLSLFLFLISNINNSNISKREDKNVISNFIDFFRDKNRTMAYFISGGVNLWWAFVYLFIPLHMIRAGLSDLLIGYFFFAVAIPLILTEYKFSNLTEKIGFRRTFKTGFFVIALISLSCFFVTNIYLMLALVVLASFGVAMLEPTTEAYFFDILKKGEENRFYGPYNTTIDVNHFIGKVSASVVLIFLPFQFLFLLFGSFMIALFLLSHKLKNVVEAKKKR